jgi:hypothetical protein
MLTLLKLKLKRGRDVVLVRDETSPEDIHGMNSSVGISDYKRRND